MSEHALWHPFSNMSEVFGEELVLDRGRDVWVWDETGRKYFDATASLWYANVGHGRPEIADAVHEQMRRLEAYSIFGDLANPPAIALADRLAELAPIDKPVVFFASGGGDGVETAVKIARRYWAEEGSSERNHLIIRTQGYHGTHGFGTALSGISANRNGWGPLDQQVSIVAHDSIDALGDEIERLGAERVAAFITEPVIGAGGVYPPGPGYLEQAEQICRDQGILFIADAVINAFGRLGTPFGVERWGLNPDLIVFAKGVTSGYLPLGGVIVSREVAAPFWNGDTAPLLRHGQTYAGHPSCCAAALANLDILEGEGLMERGRELENDLFDVLRELEELDFVEEVRGGVGLMAAIEFSDDTCRRDPDVARKVSLAVRGKGVLVRALPTALVLSPPLTATPEHFGMVAGAIRDSLLEVEATG